MRWLPVLLCGMAVAACDDTPKSRQTINGSERLGWSQAAADAVELSTFQYAIYVDGARSDLAGASCARGASALAFDCSASLPPLSAGDHALELSTVASGGIESARSEPLQVTVMGAATVSRDSATSGSSTDWPSGQTIVANDGVRLRLERLVDNAVNPTDLAFAPDGRLFVAEEQGRVRIVRQGQVATQSGRVLDDRVASQEILALAVDPAFDRTHFVYTVSATPADSGARTFALGRFREVSDTLADRVVLLDDIPARSTEPAASLRFGPDGKLFVGFDDGGREWLAGDLASPNGKILRLNPDGTTPEDQAAGNPLFSERHPSPRGMDWHPTSRMLWVADRDSLLSGRLSVLGVDDSSAKRGVRRAEFVLPSGTAPASLAFYRGGSPALRGNLFVASEKGRHLLRVRLDVRDPARIVSTERLLQDVAGGLRAVAAGPDGAIYIATASSVGRLVPE